MSIYVYTSFFLSVMVLFSGFFVYQRYKKSSWFFYLLFSILFPLWFFLYSFSFDATLSQELITRIYRFQYSLSIIGFYSILFFILFYWVLKTHFFRHTYPISIFYITIFFLSNATSLIVKGVEYNTERWLYVEIYWPLFWIFAWLYALLIPLFIIISLYKFKALSYLHRTRLVFIISWFLSFVVVSLLFNVFIPFLSEDSSKFYWENYFPFFIIPFILSVLYSSYKYDFSSYKAYLNNIFCYWFAVFFTLLWVGLFQILINITHNTSVGINILDFNFWWGELVFSLILFSCFLKISRRFHVQNIIQRKLLIIQEQLPFISWEKNISRFLKSEFSNKLSIQNTNLVFSLEWKREICGLFSQASWVEYIVNDFVFFQKHKHKFSLSKIQQEIWEEAHVVFPIFHENKEIIALLCLWKKRFSDSYTTQEIHACQDFAKFLWWYLKYVSVYKKLQDISVNLDKKVDEKTIQYNNLLNKQKEFIWYIWHEIKNPITNSIFLCDSLREEIHSIGDVHLSRRLKEDGTIMYEELMKVSNLVKQIFSTQQFDLEKIKLYRKKVVVSDFLEEEIFTFKNIYPNVEFKEDIKKWWEFELDTTQFRQVLHNVLGNALKFANQNEPVISIEVGRTQKWVLLKIEDNWEGLSEDEMQGIFNKYTTWEWDMIWLGMGLYLCKKIVELHGWKISVEKGVILWWACFIIEL